MRVALVEDEPVAMEHAEALLARIEPAARVVARLRTVRELRAWLGTTEVDVILADIQLGDGLSLDALAAAPLTPPIVFITAYDEHLVPAFASNGIAYLLKPLRETELAAALGKLRRLERHFLGALVTLARPERVVGRRGLDWVGVAAQDVAWFVARHGGTWARSFAGDELLVDESLTALAARLDGRRFFRANRGAIVNLTAVARVRSAGRGRLGLVLDPAPPEDVVVSQEHAAAFRTWFGMNG